MSMSAVERVFSLGWSLRWPINSVTHISIYQPKGYELSVYMQATATQDSGFPVLSVQHQTVQNPVFWKSWLCNMPATGNFCALFESKWTLKSLQVFADHMSWHWNTSVHVFIYSQDKWETI